MEPIQENVETTPVVNVEDNQVNADEIVIFDTNVDGSDNAVISNDITEPVNLVDELLSVLSGKLNENGVDLNASNMSDIVRYGMEVVEISTAPKEERKQLVLDMVAKLVETSDIEENQKQACLHILESDLLSNLIELLIKASKGELELNQETVEEVLEVTGGCCFAFLKFFKRQ